jgi:hypothetical protein
MKGMRGSQKISLLDGDVHVAQNKRFERTRHERASLISCVGEPLKRNVRYRSQ